MKTALGYRCAPLFMALGLGHSACAQTEAFTYRRSAAAAPHARPNPTRSEPIPTDHIGAVVGKQYQGDGLAVAAAPGGARLRCVFQRLEGQATWEGLWLASTFTNGLSERFRVVATAVRRGPLGAANQTSTEGNKENQASDGNSEAGTPLVVSLAKGGGVEVVGQVARFVRLGLTEEYSLSVDGVRQDFLMPERPAGAGPLRVELEVAGATVEPLPNGAQLVLDGSARKIAYSLRATDAAGRELVSRLEVTRRVEAAAADDACDSVLECGSRQPLWPGPESTERGRRLPRSKDSRGTAGLAVVVDDAGAAYPLRIDPTFSDANWISLGGLPGADSSLFAAVVDGSGNLYIGGTFAIAGDVIANGIAKWDGSSWSALGPGMNSTDSALAASGNDLYAGGFFTTAGGNAANYIGKWKGSSWTALGLGMNGYVYALAASGSDMYAGGEVTTATNNGGVAVMANRIAKWNGSAWSALGSGLNNTVSALAASGGEVYAGGEFTRATNSGGVAITANYIARWNGSAWGALGSGLSGPYPYVYALAVSGSDLYAGGGFIIAGGCLAKWNGSSWTALGSGVGVTYPYVYALAVSGSALYAGGSFTTAGGKVSGYAAKANVYPPILAIEPDGSGG